MIYLFFPPCYVFSPLFRSRYSILRGTLYHARSRNCKRHGGKTGGNMLRWAKAAIQLPLNWMLLLVLHGISFRGNAHTCRDVVISWNILKKCLNRIVLSIAVFTPHTRRSTPDWLRRFRQLAVPSLAEASTESSVNSLGTTKRPEFGQRCFWMLFIVLFIYWLIELDSTFFCVRIYLFITQSWISIFYFFETPEEFCN